MRETACRGPSQRDVPSLSRRWASVASGSSMLQRECPAHRGRGDTPRSRRLQRDVARHGVCPRPGGYAGNAGYARPHTSRPGQTGKEKVSLRCWSKGAEASRGGQAGTTAEGEWHGQTQANRVGQERQMWTGAGRGRAGAAGAVHATRKIIRSLRPRGPAPGSGPCRPPPQIYVKHAGGGGGASIGRGF